MRHVHVGSTVILSLTLVTPWLVGARHVLPEADSLTGVPQERISPAQARLRIEQHIAVIESRKKDMTALYENGAAARRTMEQSLIKYGASSSKIKADSSSVWVYTLWSDASQFYTFHLAALRESLSAILAKEYVLSGDLEYLDRGMLVWRSEEEKLRNLMEQCVDLRGQYGAFYEKYDAYRSNYYPGGHHKTTKIEDYMRQFDEERKRREADEAVVDSSARSYSRKRVFEALRRINVLSDKAPGANDKQEP